MVFGITGTHLQPPYQADPFEEGLQSWVNSAPVGKLRNYSEAAQRIREAKQQNQTALTLSGLHLDSLPASLGSLRNLTKLDLRANQLTSIPTELGSLRNLTKLDLRANQLTSIPTELGSLINLTELYLSNNQLTRIPTELGSLINLTGLYLSENQLTSIPTELGSLRNLTKLNLSNNQLTSIPTELGSLINLTKLNLSNNQLTSIPTELGSLINLTELYLSNNQLTSIPTELGSLINLTKLNLSNNQLTSIPTELGSLINLTELYLSNNQLTRIPTELGSLRNLTKLNLSCNQLTSIPTELGSLINLTGLYLIENQLTRIPTELESLINLTELYLSNNQLTRIPTELGSLFSLKQLFLNNNSNLASVPMALGELANLTTIDFDRTAVPQSIQDTITQMQNARRAANSANELPARLNLWKSFAKSDTNLSFILNHDKAPTINEWLLRLERTKQFKYHQEALATTTCEMLSFLKDHEDFSTTFLIAAESNNEACADRAAQFFNLIYTNYKLLSLPEGASVKEKLTLFLRAAKTLTLRDHVDALIREEEATKAADLMAQNSLLPPDEAEKIAVEKEAVEIQLFVETSLKNRLNLLTAIDVSTYANTIGNRPFINLTQIENWVNEHYLDNLDELIGFEEFATKVDAILREQLNALERNETYLHQKRDILKEWASGN